MVRNGSGRDATNIVIREKNLNTRMKDRLDKKSTHVLVGDLRNSYVTNFPVRSVGHNW